MQFCGSLLVSCLLFVTVLRCSVDGFRVDGFRTQQQPTQRVDRPASRAPAAPRPRPRAMKEGEELTAKLLRLDDLVRTENDVMEPKRKRSFPGNGAPLDRLSAGAMETKQGTPKQSKVVEIPRRRVNPPPIDRIGIGRLPNGRG